MLFKLTLTTYKDLEGLNAQQIREIARQVFAEESAKNFENTKIEIAAANLQEETEGCQAESLLKPKSNYLN